MIKDHRVLAVVAGIAVAAALILTGGVASASCVPPTVEYDAGAVERGALLTVRGKAFGDNCYDTGPPPAGLGVLGNPLPGIVVSVIQNGHVFVVAKGSADARYAFEATFPVPNDLAPGEATILVSAPTSSVLDATDAPLIVSDTAPLVVTEDVTSFGPQTIPPSSQAAAPTTPSSPQQAAESPSVASQTEQSMSGGERWLLTGIVGLLLVGCLAALTVRRRRRRTAAHRP